MEIVMNTSFAKETARTDQCAEMRTKTLLAFLAIRIGLSWVPMALFMLFPDQLTSIQW